MDPETFKMEITSTKQFFDKSTACLTEDDSTFAPAEGMMTTAQQVAHVAQTVDWFLEGAFRPEGFDMDMEKLAVEVGKVTSLTAAREWLDRAFAAAEKAIEMRPAEDWQALLPEGPVMGGMPRGVIFGAIADHTTHHRGALTVYARLCGHVPEMPYM